MDQIRESLDRLSELSDDDLKSLKESVVSEFKTVEAQDLTQDTVQQMNDLVNAKEAIVGELSQRAELATQLAAAAADAAARIQDPEEEPDAAEAAIDDSTVDENSEVIAEDADTEVVDHSEEVPVPKEELPAEDEEEEKVDDDEEDKDKFASEEVTTSIVEPVESEAAAKSAETVIEEPAAENKAAEEVIEENKPEAEETASEEVNQESSEEPVTASINSDGLDIEAPADRRPKIDALSVPITITAGADIPHVAAGSPLPDLKSVASALIARKTGMGRTSGGDGEQHTVATFTTEFPDSRYLTRNDIEGNRNKIENVTEASAITAAGGLYAPVEIRYELFGLGDLGRPVKDSLAVFGAERGGIRFVTPPVLTDLNGAISLWTLQDDIDAATDGAPNPVKPCLRVNSGAEVTVNIEAITLCLTFGNMGARAYPELVERHTQLAMINHARFAETRLLTRIGSLSTAVTAAAELGAARDIFGQVDQAAAAYRSRHRMDVDTPLRAIFPEWFKNALRQDLLKQLPGDGNDDTFGLVDAKVTAWFKVRNINVTWAMDGESGQVFGAQTAGALLPYPGTVIWYLFAEGTFLFLDGGTLDLGIVRDSTLNGTNDYKIFLETFENVAKVGIESLRVSSALAIYGASAATVDTTGAAV